MPGGSWPAFPSGGLRGLFLLGRLSRRARSSDAAIGVSAGVLMIVWMTTSPSWPDSLAALRSPFHPNVIIVIGTVTVWSVGVLLGSILGVRSANRSSRLDV
jgi:solute:Na+ symporter, SSS family